jgi:hypothetical protein
MSMSQPQEEFDYTIALEDIDKSLLPGHARTPGTDAFREAVTRLIAKDYEAFGGYARIVVDDHNVQVYWRSDPDAPHPMQVVLDKIKRGEYAEACDGGLGGARQQARWAGKQPRHGQRDGQKQLEQQQQRVAQSLERRIDMQIFNDLLP